jgi:putative tryptophan/tyrosine transport system substrate-binding protein
MRRREFIMLFGGAAAAWPLAARAQQHKLPTIGFLGGASALAESQWAAAFVQRLHQLGWTEGRTVAIEYRWAEGRNEPAEIVAEFVRRKVDIIVTYGTPSILAAKQATSAIPIVFAAAGDPVRTGIVASLARPSGNVTVTPGDRSYGQADRAIARGGPRSPPIGTLGQCRQSPGRGGDR